MMDVGRSGDAWKSPRNSPKAAIPTTGHSTCTIYTSTYLIPTTTTTTAMPDISYEALAGAALVIVLAVGYQYLPKADEASGPGGTSGKSKKKNKKKAKGKGEDEASGSASEEVKKGVEAVKPVNGKKDKAAPNPQAKSTPTPAPPPITPSTAAPSFAEVAAEETEEKPKPKTLAQKIAPKNRKSKVDE